MDVFMCTPVHLHASSQRVIYFTIHGITHDYFSATLSLLYTTNRFDLVMKVTMRSVRSLRWWRAYGSSSINSSCHNFLSSYSSSFSTFSSSSSSSSFIPSSGKATRTTSFKVDRSGLMQVGEDWPSQEEIDRVAQHKEDLSPLGKILRNNIKMRGPMTVHDFMSQALHHEKYGYYQQKREKIGKEGDFITSPEISQLFGEIIAVWCVSTWENMGKPSSINLVELGPGNGTLMKDMMGIMPNFPEFQSALKISMVEVSASMRDIQLEKLECSEVSHNEKSDSDACLTAKLKSGTRISWYNYLRQVPSGPALYVGHEILDAFPVHQFVKTTEAGKWREVMVDVDFQEESRYHFRFVKTPTITPALRIFFNEKYTSTLNKPLFTKKQEPDENSDDNSPSVSAISTENLNGLEISPLAFSTVEEIAKNVMEQNGAALLIDYGEHFPQEDTLRGFKKHEPRHVLSEPGTVDITADVNFAACAQIAKEYGAQVQGSITQGQFLFNMGLVTRVEQVIDADSTTDEKAQDLVLSTEKILTGGMGNKFKAISFSHPDIKIPGF